MPTICRLPMTLLTVGAVGMFAGTFVLDMNNLPRSINSPPLAARTRELLTLPDRQSFRMLCLAQAMAALGALFFRLGLHLLVTAWMLTIGPIVLVRLLGLLNVLVTLVRTLLCTFTTRLPLVLPCWIVRLKALVVLM